MSTSEVKLTTKKIKGSDVDIFATENGTFTATVNGEKVEKPTLQQLVDRVGVMLAVKLKPVELTMLDSPGWHESKRPAKFKTVKLMGIHSANGNLLVNTGQVTQQLSARDGLYVLLTAEQQEEYFRLSKVKDEAYAEFEKWKEKYTVTPKLAHKLLGLIQKKTAGV